MKMEYSKLIIDFLDYDKDFPIEEFNQKIEEIVGEKPEKIKEKEIQDFMHDVLRDNGILTGRLIIDIYFEWPKTIEKAMFLKKYIRSRVNPDIYIPLQKKF